MLKKLNLGCGSDIKQGFVNLDSAKLPGVDIVHDLEKLPLPLPSDAFEEVLCQDVLEHLDYPRVLKEIHRSMAKGGVLKIRVPHFTSKNNFIDPTHKKMFSIKTFGFFVKNTAYDRDYYFDFHFEKIGSAKITFEGSSRIFFFNRLPRWFVNKSSRMQYLYESTFLSRLFPAENILIELVK